MEQVFVVAKTSFVNQVVGSVNRKQKLLINANLAKEFVGMGLVDYADNEVKVESVKKFNQSPKVQEDGQATQSVSLPVETASQTHKLDKPKKINLPKNGK
jgi:hypothetical protein